MRWAGERNPLEGAAALILRFGLKPKTALPSQLPADVIEEGRSHIDEVLGPRLRRRTGEWRPPLTRHRCRGTPRRLRGWSRALQSFATLDRGSRDGGIDEGRRTTAFSLLCRS
jgi:hypothetical protein